MQKRTWNLGGETLLKWLNLDITLQLFFTLSVQLEKLWEGSSRPPATGNQQKTEGRGKDRTCKPCRGQQRPFFSVECSCTKTKFHMEFLFSNGKKHSKIWLRMHRTAVFRHQFWNSALKSSQLFKQNFCDFTDYLFKTT